MPSFFSYDKILDDGIRRNDHRSLYSHIGTGVLNADSNFRPVIWVERSYTMIPGESFFFSFTIMIPEHGHLYVRYALTNFRNPMTANLFLCLHIMAVRRGWKGKWNRGGLITGWTTSVRFLYLFT